MDLLLKISWSLWILIKIKNNCLMLEREVDNRVHFSFFLMIINWLSKLWEEKNWKLCLKFKTQLLIIIKNCKIYHCFQECTELQPLNRIILLIYRLLSCRMFNNFLIPKLGIQLILIWMEALKIGKQY